MLHKSHITSFIGISPLTEQCTKASQLGDVGVDRCPELKLQVDGALKGGHVSHTTLMIQSSGTLLEWVTCMWWETLLLQTGRC